MTRLAAIAVLAGIAYLALEWLAWHMDIRAELRPAHRRLLDHGGVG